MVTKIRTSNQSEDINCDGCTTQNGAHSGYCSVCEIRLCGAEKQIKNCAYCDEYKCEKLAKFHEHTTKAEEKLEQIRKKLAK